MLGLFINTLPVIQTLDPQQALGDWLRQLQAYNLAIRDFEHTPLADIQRWAGQGGQGLFDSIIVFENHPVDRALRGEQDGELKFAEVGSGGVTNFPMDLMVSATEQGLEVEYLYLRERFTADQVERIRAQLEGLLAQLPLDAACLIGDIGLPGAQVQVPQDATPVADLLHRFAAQVAQQPHATALLCDGRELSYAALNTQADALAVQLQAQGIGPEQLVAVALPRSEQTLVAFLAVLKAGAAYLPLDLDYPAERLTFMLDDSGASLLLCHSDVDQRVRFSAATPRLLLDQLQPLAATPQPVPALAGHLAYLIYTSGSTGQPKGVAVAREPIARHCQGIIELYELTPASRELHFMSFAFDGAQERWLSVLLAGGSLVIRDDTLWTPEQTLQVLHEQRVTVACFPPAYLQQLAEVALTQGTPPAVHTYCFGGDAVPDASFELVKRALLPKRLVNGYGPTETVVTPLLWRAEVTENCDAAYAPIGRSVAGRGVYVLDADMNPLPVGVSGELYLGGECLARGYHRQPGLSAERFVPDPFCAGGGRMYRTGDRVRLRECGLVDYLGRLDQQVKIRCFRIELGEIEARLRQCEGVQDAAVKVLESATGKQLVGYVVAAPNAGLERALKEHLQAQLPDYMVPTHIVALARFPLSANGKLDRRALPEPPLAQGQYRAPRNALEQALAVIWQEVLGLEQVGIDDNFFELGGDSLQVLKVISRVRNQPQLGISLKLRDLMQKPCIAELSGFEPPVSARSPDPLLALNSRVNHVPPLFCLHAGFGTVFDYEPLARKLDGRRSVYGVQCRMLLDPQWQDESLQAMAQAYAERIRQQQASGPYYLLGWSLGGALTLLVAQALEAQGQQVAFAGLVDSYVAGTAQASDEREDVQDFLRFVLGLSEAEAQTVVGDAGAEAAIAAAMAKPRSPLGEHGLLDAAELSQIFAVGTRLKQLALGHCALPKTRVAAHHWWVAGREDERRVHAAQIAAGASHGVLSGGHYDLLRNATLLAELDELLGGQAVERQSS